MRAKFSKFCDIRMPLFVGLWLLWAAALIGLCAILWTYERITKIVLAFRGRA